MKQTNFDFSGYATKIDLKCSDGRVIKKDAFKHNDGKKVPLVWQHIHTDPMNVLGHGILENRSDGVYVYGYFNDTESGKQAKALVEHGDIDALSIFANQLKQKGDDVLHGNIREVSLVYAGANVGAFIDNVTIKHADGEEEADLTAAIIFSSDTITHGDIEHSGGGDEDAGGDETLGEIFETLSDKQKDVVYVMIAQLTGEGDDMEHSDGSSIDPDGEDLQAVFDTMSEKQKGAVYVMIAHAMEQNEESLNHSDDEGGTEMKKNVFDKEDGESVGVKNTLSHAEFSAILGDAQKYGSLKESILAHAVEYGIENIDILFPEAKTLQADPQWLKREDDWVQGVLGAVRKSPFSRVKSMFADMNIDTARAKGYITGTEKKEVYFKMSKRVTTPTTIYVKQKLDRDDIIDIVDFDAVAMVRMQMRTLLDEELALALLLGDGRAADDQYKINEENIRPIWTEEDFYAVKEVISSKTDYKKIIKEIALSHGNYKGTGNPTLYTTQDMVTNMLWIEDTTGRRIYNSIAELATAMRVSTIKEIPPMVGKSRINVDNDTCELLAIKVNLGDYTLGADKGGQVASFQDFDIDFNQEKFLMETRCSGSLTKPKSAQIYEFVTAG